MAVGKKKIAAGIVAGASASVLFWLYAEQLDEEHEALVADQVEVVKAAREVPAGTPLTKDRITTEKVPRKFLPPNPLLESELNIYLGTPVAVDVEEGAMILTSDFSVALVQPALISPLVIKTATLRLEADSPTNSGQSALAAVATSGGYIVSSDIHVTRDSQSFSMVARVPASEFESVIFGMNDLGTAVERRVRGAGVSADVQRLERKLGNNEFLIEGLRNAKNVTKKSSRRQDTIEIIAGDKGDSTYRSHTVETQDGGAETEKELVLAHHAQVELQDELSTLHAETALATIELTIVQPLEEIVPPAPLSFSDEVSAEFQASSRILVRGGFMAVRATAAALPILVFLSPFFLAIGLWVRRRRQLA